MNRNKKIGYLIIVLLLIVGVVWRIQDCFKLNIWSDERSSLYSSEGSLKETWKKSIHHERQTPTYFLFLNLWRRIDPSIEFSRLLSVLFSITSIFFVYKIWIYLFGSKWMWVAPLFYTFNSFHIWAASEARVYALVILLCIASSYYFIKILINKHKQQKISYYFLYFLLSILGIYSFYPFAFLVLGHFIAALIWLKGKKLGAILLCYILMGVSLLFWVPVLKYHFLYSISWGSAHEAKLDFIVSEPKSLQLLVSASVPFYQFAKSVIYIPNPSIGAKIFIMMFFYGILGVLLCMRFLFDRKRPTIEEKVLMTTIITPFLFLSVLHFLNIGVSTVRYYAIISIAVLFMVVLIYNLENKIFKKFFVGLIIIVFFALSIWHDIRNPKNAPIADSCPRQVNLSSQRWEHFKVV